jgi:acyl-CoA hydrolase/GNAT superfamily N-acetyltransferase
MILSSMNGTRNGVVSAHDALAGLRSGMRVFVGSGCAAPQMLVGALGARGPDVYDVEVVHILTFGSAEYAREDLLEHFRHNAFFIGPNVRAAVNAGIADYTPIFLSDIPRLFRERRMHLDYALVQVSPPDAHGFCSFGISVDVVKAAVQNADVVVAEVNPNMPRTLGDSFVHVSQINFFVESELPLIEFPPKQPSTEATQIGEHIARLIEDGSTLQTGIGEIPSAIMSALSGKRDLGMHTEMFTEAVIPLIESGVLNCARKSSMPGKIVTSFCFGTRHLYDYVHDNPRFAFMPTEFTNDPFEIARNDRMVAVSSALEVDLTGQVCADSVGDVFYSGFGGQVDFMRGAARSQGGKPIIALLATAKGGAVSRIVPMLRPGAGVVTTRADVHYVVTEYGVAELHGRSVRERALALINIAHPKFRDELMRAARDRRLVHPKQIALPPGLRYYPSKYESELRLADGSLVHFRPVRPKDERLLKEMFYAHSEETIVQRYFAKMSHLPHEDGERMVTLDYRDDMALVGMLRANDTESLACVARYHRTAQQGTAEFMVTVRDELQGRGLGRLILLQLIRVARENGISYFQARFYASNERFRKMLQDTVGAVDSTLEGEYLCVRFPLPPPDDVRGAIATAG